MFDVVSKSQRSTMFNKISKNTTTIPILSGKDLLKSSKCRLLLKKLPLFLKIPLSRYQRHYLKTIENFAELVQSLPATVNEHYAHRGGMLELGLARAFEVIKYHRKQRPGSSRPDKGENLELQRWELTLFTAALFYDLGKLGADFYVMICDAKAKSLGQWNPLNGDMRKFGTHFRYCFTSDNTNLLRRNLTPLLARQIVPKPVFDWIAADKYVLQSWLSLLENLSEDGSGSGGGGNRLVLVADAFVINAFNKELYKEQNSKDKAAVKRSNVEKDMQHMLSERASKLQESGKTSGTVTDAFIEWLRKGIGDGKIKVNGKNIKTSHVHIVREGVFLEKGIFEKFAKAHAEYGKTGDAIYNEFKETKGRALHGEMQYHVEAGEKKQARINKNQPHAIHVSGLERRVAAGVVIPPTDIFHNNVVLARFIDATLTTPSFNAMTKHSYPGVLAAHAAASKAAQPTPRG